MEINLKIITIIFAIKKFNNYNKTIMTEHRALMLSFEKCEYKLSGLGVRFAYVAYVKHFGS